LAVQVWLAAQLPQSNVPPQPSETVPQFFPRPAQVFKTQVLLAPTVTNSFHVETHSPLRQILPLPAGAGTPIPIFPRIFKPPDLVWEITSVFIGAEMLPSGGIAPGSLQAIITKHNPSEATSAHAATMKFFAIIFIIYLLNVFII